MEEYIICPCCKKKIRLLEQDGKLAVFFVTQNQEKLRKVLSDNGIEIGTLKGGETIE
jgi:hypothetical protein